LTVVEKSAMVSVRKTRAIADLLMPTSLESNQSASSSEADSQKWSAIITNKKPLFDIPVAELWSYRDLIFVLVRRDLVSTHKQTILGPLWHIINPTISSVIFTVIFGKILQLPTNEVPPFLFYMSGIVIWYYFSSCLTKSSTTFSSNAPLFSKVYFPRLTVPIALAIANIWHFIIQFAIFLAFYLFFFFRGAPIEPNYRVIIIPLLVLQTALLGIGAGCFISAITTRFRDLQLIVGPAIQLWMYASCIFYPRSLAEGNLPAGLQWLLNVNPMISIIETFRFAIMGQGQVQIWQWLISLAITLAVFMLGIIEFGRAEKTSADTI
jgi:lipopolysaccharide transport system permease protein